MKKSQGALEARVSNALTLHLEEFQTKDMIDIIEKRVDEQMQRIQKLEEPRQKAFDEYEKLQNQYDALKSRWDADKRLLDSLSRYQNNIKNGVDIRIVRGESHNDMKPREKKKYERKRSPIQFAWTEYGIETLQKEAKFMTMEELWDMVAEKYSIKEKLQAAGKAGKFSNIKWGAIHNCWTANSKSTREGGSRGRLVMIGDHIGLKEWTSSDFKPLAQYVKGNGNGWVTQAI